MRCLSLMVHVEALGARIPGQTRTFVPDECGVAAACVREVLLGLLDLQAKARNPRS